MFRKCLVITTFLPCIACLCLMLSGWPSRITCADDAVEVSGNTGSSVDLATIPDPDQLIIDAFSDAAFEQYVDVELIGVAIAHNDVELLTDSALQLAEGERILLRAHHSLTADDVFLAAIRMAERTGDVQGLERLGKAVAGRSQELASRVEAARALAGTSREAEPPVMVPVNSVTPDSVAIFRDLARRIEIVAISGDADEASSITEAIELADQLADSQVEHLKKMLSEVTIEGADTDDRHSETLNALAAASRGWFSRATGFRTPQPVSDVAPNGISLGSGSNRNRQKRRNGSGDYDTADSSDGSDDEYAPADGSDNYDDDSHYGSQYEGEDQQADRPEDTGFGTYLTRPGVRRPVQRRRRTRYQQHQRQQAQNFFNRMSQHSGQFNQQLQQQRSRANAMRLQQLQRQTDYYRNHTQMMLQQLQQQPIYYSR